MFESGRKYTNRYGDDFEWQRLDENTYMFRMTGKSLENCRVGGKEGQPGLDWGDLGMFDPSGGPYVELGTKIDGKSIVHIGNADNGFVVEVG